MALLSREQVVANNRLPHVDVDVPELGEGAQVRIRTMRGHEKESLSLAMAESRKANKGGAGFMSTLVCQCAIDEQGAPLFGSPEDAGSLNGVALERLFRAAFDLNGMGKSDEDILKNSGAARSAVSSSDSPSD